MHIFVCDVSPTKRLIEVFITCDDRRILAYWLPEKYPHRARIDRIVKGPALDRAQFIALAEGIPVILRSRMEAVDQVEELKGRSFFINWSMEGPLQGVELDSDKG